MAETTDLKRVQNEPQATGPKPAAQQQPAMQVEPFPGTPQPDVPHGTSDVSGQSRQPQDNAGTNGGQGGQGEMATPGFGALSPDDLLLIEYMARSDGPSTPDVFMSRLEALRMSDRPFRRFFEE